MTSSPTQSKTLIRRGDTVKVLRGKDRGKTGKVMAVLPQEERVVVEGLNMIKKHVKARRSNEKGQRVTVAAPLRLSNVQAVCPQCGKATRIKINRTGKTRTRECRKCNAVIDTASKA